MDNETVTVEADKTLEEAVAQVENVVQLSRDALFGMRPKQKDVVLKSTGSEITVRQLSQGQANSIRKSCTNVNGVLIEDKFQIAMVTECLVSPQINKEDAEALDDIPAEVFAEIGHAVLDINGLVQKEDAKKD
jgi:hypothetical protein